MILFKFFMMFNIDDIAFDVSFDVVFSLLFVFLNCVNVVYSV